MKRATKLSLRVFLTFRPFLSDHLGSGSGLHNCTGAAHVKGHTAVGARVRMVNDATGVVPVSAIVSRYISRARNYQIELIKRFSVFIKKTDKHAREYLRPFLFVVVLVRVDSIFQMP